MGHTEQHGDDLRRSLEEPVLRVRLRPARADHAGADRGQRLGQGPDADRYAAALAEADAGVLAWGAGWRRRAGCSRRRSVRRAAVVAAAGRVRGGPQFMQTIALGPPPSAPKAPSMGGISLGGGGNGSSCRGRARKGRAAARRAADAADAAGRPGRDSRGDGGRQQNRPPQQQQPRSKRPAVEAPEAPGAGGGVELDAAVDAGPAGPAAADRCRRWRACCRRRRRPSGPPPPAFTPVAPVSGTGTQFNGNAYQPQAGASGDRTPPGTVYRWGPNGYGYYPI